MRVLKYNTPHPTHSMDMHDVLMDAYSRGCAFLTEVWPQHLYYDDSTHSSTNNTKKRRPLVLLRMRAYAELHWRASIAAQWGTWANTTTPALRVEAMPVGMLELVMSVYRFACHPYKVCNQPLTGV